MDSKQSRPTTPEEEGIELYPDAMERTERAVKDAFRTGPVSKGTIRQAIAARGKAKPKRQSGRS